MRLMMKKLEKIGIFDQQFTPEKILAFHSKFCQDLTCERHMLFRHEFMELMIRLSIEKTRKGTNKNDILKNSGIFIRFDSLL